MKIRLDYVTNSSSSSFLVAIRKDINEKRLNEFLDRIEDDVLNYVINNYHYLSISDEIENHIKNHEFEKIWPLIREELKEYLTQKRYSALNIGVWNVFSEEISNESCSLPEILFYDCSRNLQESDYIKCTI